MSIQKTNLLAVYSLQTNMLSAVEDPNDETKCLIMLNSGKTLCITCDNNRQVSEILNTLHFYPVFTRMDNNSVEKNFTFIMHILE